MHDDATNGPVKAAVQLPHALQVVVVADAAGDAGLLWPRWLRYHAVGYAVSASGIWNLARRDQLLKHSSASRRTVNCCVWYILHDTMVQLLRAASV